MTSGQRHVFSVQDGVYAGAPELHERVLADDTVIWTLDDAGDELHVARALSENPPEDLLLPIVCFTAVETGSDGC